MKQLVISQLVTKSMQVIEQADGRRIFTAVLSAETVDKDGEILLIDEMLKVVPIWIQRGGTISDTHSNHIVGKGLSYRALTVKDKNDVDVKAIEVTCEIFKNYRLDDVIWSYITSGYYKGVSFGGASKSGRIPIQLSNGNYAYQIGDLEQYEMAVCKTPSNPLSIITSYNELAKAVSIDVLNKMNIAETLHNGNVRVQCTSLSCIMNKAFEEDNAKPAKEELDAIKPKKEDSGNSDDDKKEVVLASSASPKPSEASGLANDEHGKTEVFPESNTPEEPTEQFLSSTSATEEQNPLLEQESDNPFDSFLPFGEESNPALAVDDSPKLEIIVNPDLTIDISIPEGDPTDRYAEEDMSKKPVGEAQQEAGKPQFDFSQLTNLEADGQNNQQEESNRDNFNRINTVESTSDMVTEESKPAQGATETKEVPKAVEKSEAKHFDMEAFANKIASSVQAGLEKSFDAKFSTLKTELEGKVADSIKAIEEKNKDGANANVSTKEVAPNTTTQLENKPYNNQGNAVDDKKVEGDKVQLETDKAGDISKSTARPPMGGNGTMPFGASAGENPIIKMFRDGVPMSEIAQKINHKGSYDNLVKGAVNKATGRGV